MRVKMERISRTEKRCIGEQTGEECKNEGTPICHGCNLYAGIPNSRAVKTNMFR